MAPEAEADPLSQPSSAGDAAATAGEDKESGEDEERLPPIFSAMQCPGEVEESGEEEERLPPIFTAMQCPGEDEESGEEEERLPPIFSAMECPGTFHPLPTLWMHLWMHGFGAL